MSTAVTVISPHTTRNGNTVTSALIALGLTETKRRIFLTHASETSIPFQTYFGVDKFEDKSTTSTQLVKLLREGAVGAKDVSEYCITVQGYLDVFTSVDSLFGEEEMRTLLTHVLNSDAYDMTVIDMDLPLSHPNAKLIMAKTDLVVLNISPDFVELKMLKEMLPDIAKLCKGKQLFLVCNRYDSVAMKKLKMIPDFLGLKTNCYAIRDNSWIKWSCNNKKLAFLFNRGKVKDGSVNEIYTSAVSISNKVFKARNKLMRAKRGG